MIEPQYICHADGTSYRVRPNPDTDAVDGSGGVVLEWSDDSGKSWDGYFHIGPDAAMDVARSIVLLMTGKPMEE